ncbi:MAG: ATP-binding protein, partial [Armatimonadota bacterium]
RESATTARTELLDAVDGVWVESGEGLRAAVSALDDWEKSDRRCCDAQDELDRHQRTIADLGTDIQALFAGYDYVTEADPADALKVFPTWFDASTDCATAQTNALDRQTDLESRLRDMGLTSWDSIDAARDRIRERAEPARRYAALTAEAASENRSADLLAEDGEDAVLQNHGLSRTSEPTRLESVIEDLRVQSGRAGELRETIGATRNAISAMLSPKELAESERALELGIDALQEHLAQTALGSARRVVRAEIERSVRDENTPAVVESANAWLRTFTGGRYDQLTVPEIAEGRGADGTDKRELTVIDRLDDGRAKSMSQLSAGARSHLTLAVRIAVIEEAEKQSPKFPLVMDEVLATSGPEARTAIASAVHAIARERQVLFLTNDPNDLALLREQAPAGIAESLVEVALRGPIPMTAGPNAPEPEAPERVPESLPLWQPFAVWPEEWRIRATRGADSEPTDAIDAAAEAIRIRVAAAVKPVTWPDLMASGTVGDGMRDRVALLFGGAPLPTREFLAQLGSVPGFGPSRKANVTRWLRENGYLEAGPAEAELVAAAMPYLEGKVDLPGLVALGLARFFEPYLDRTGAGDTDPS